MNKADLHCHSTCSDGTNTPLELIEKAHQLGLTGLSITDHDTVAAYHIAKDLAKKLNISLITGAEFTTFMNDTSIHILAYSFHPDHPLIRNFTERHTERRLARTKEILENLRKHQLPIREEELTHLGSIGRPHIAQAMVKKGYVANIQEAFKKYLGEGKPCYAVGEKFTVQETLDVIHQAGGVAILAHPHLIDRKRLVRQLLEMEFDGLEVYYARMSKNHNQPWLKKAEERSWLITGGSDFHGDMRPESYLGSSWTPEESFSYLLTLFENNLQQ